MCPYLSVENFVRAETDRVLVLRAQAGGVNRLKHTEFRRRICGGSDDFA
jgi:hypothetical protein